MRPNKKYLCLELPDLPYLLVKPRTFSGFLGKRKILCILKGKMPFKVHKCIKLYFFPKKIIKTESVPTLPKIFRPVIHNSHLLIYLA